MTQSVDKMHDSIMNTIDWTLENNLKQEWKEFAATKQYDRISAAIWELCSGEIEEGED